jgi:hydroxyacylglutathione hydrolase
MKLEVTTFITGKWRQNCYLVSDPKGAAIIIDPGGQAEEIAALVDEKGLKPHAIVNTHAHYDHVGAVAPLKDRYSVPFYLHSADETLLKRANLYRMLFESHDAIRVPTATHDISQLAPDFTIGPFDVTWISTPGHTEGSVCFLLGGSLFSGDTLMHNALGRTDLPGGNRERLLTSVRKLMQLPGDTVVYGGHGPPTTLEAEFAAGALVLSLLA